jgi:hypothetical protein
MDHSATDLSIDQNLTLERSFQPQKVYVENLHSASTPRSLEKPLWNYFADFGSVIDVKVLKNGELIRSGPTLRICQFRRGGNNP